MILTLLLILPKIPHFPLDATTLNANLSAVRMARSYRAGGLEPGQRANFRQSQGGIPRHLSFLARHGLRDVRCFHNSSFASPPSTFTIARRRQLLPTPVAPPFCPTNASGGGARSAVAQPSRSLQSCLIVSNQGIFYAPGAATMDFPRLFSENPLNAFPSTIYASNRPLPINPQSRLIKANQVIFMNLPGPAFRHLSFIILHLSFHPFICEAQF